MFRELRKKEESYQNHFKILRTRITFCLSQLLRHHKQNFLFVINIFSIDRKLGIVKCFLCCAVLHAEPV